ncbi:MAG: hypothetical protein KAS63_00395 [Candidatus Heimdallarchaeota archaeon]|nr:hypothetical protein [Candidatus Heimdallarchaeota archaeon]MCK4953802.1 hypothetical protein [Candidatus Heimdallarchaeota archaeon]
MEPIKTSILDEITEKLKSNLDASFWKGRGNREMFRETVKNLVASEILSKDEYNYLLKNERRVLVKTQLLHLIPELQSQEVIENTVRHLSSVILEKKYKEAETKREDIERQIINQISSHLNSTFHPKIITVKDAFSHMEQLIDESSDVSKELLKISNQLIVIRDSLLEKGHSSLLLHEIERLSTKLVFAAKSNNPEDIPSREEILNWINEVKKNSGVVL